MAKRNELAHKLLSTLHDLTWDKTLEVYKVFSVKTTSILIAAGIPNTSRPMCLQVLHAAVKAGILDVRGQGVLRWKFATKYSPTDSYAELGGGSSERKPKPKPEIEVEKTPCPKCNGTGKWVNPNNAADIRDCFNCNGTGQVGGRPSSSDPGLRKELETLKALVEELKNRPSGGPVKIEIKKHDGEIIELVDQVLPKAFQDVLDLCSVRENVLLVGPAGCGKTYIGELVAKALGLEFSAISCTDGMSETHLLGKGTPNIKTGANNFVGTPFLDRFENGGIFLIDEIDAANSNLLLAINSALANGYANVPNRASQPRAERHPDFICIATANTFGRGANRQYVGRNQLDEATLDRFRMGTIEVDYDQDVERSICPDTELLHRLWAIRKAMESQGLRRFLSTRFIKSAYKMRHACAWSLTKIEERFMSGWSDDEKTRVKMSIAR